jgi:hypothetical protein
MNIAEILKYCPKGTKLYSTVFGEVEFSKINPDDIIVINVKDIGSRVFLRNGSYSKYGECVLFPSKDMRDWSKFRLPVKRGDIMMSDNRAFIISDEYANVFNGAFHKYICGIDADNRLFINPSNVAWTSKFYIPASEEAKKELFDKMAEAGYKWNADTLELEKIKPCFKEGDILVDKYNRLILCTGVIIGNRVQTCADIYNTTLIIYQPSLYDEPISALRLATKEERNKFYSSLVKEGYKYDKEQHGLVKQKFKPFDKVLIRDGDNQTWRVCLFSHYRKDLSCPYVCVGCSAYKQCIPYEGNEYLLGTTDSPI